MSENDLVHWFAVACVFVGGTIILLGTLAAWLHVMDWLWRHVLDQLGWRARQQKEKESP